MTSTSKRTLLKKGRKRKGREKNRVNIKANHIKKKAEMIMYRLLIFIQIHIFMNIIKETKRRQRTVSRIEYHKKYFIRLFGKFITKFKKILKILCFHYRISVSLSFMIFFVM